MASVAAQWRVSGFKRDEVSYYQVKDGTGCVHVVIGHVGTVFWAVPHGAISARTSLPSWRFRIPEHAVPSEVYRNAAFSLWRHDDGIQPVWSVELPESDVTASRTQ